MGTVLDNFHDAVGKPIQPYFAAFMIEKGYTHASHIFKRDGHGLEYMEWNNQAWSEFERANGHPVNHITRNSRSAEFKNWLAARAVDTLARRSIEAA